MREILFRGKRIDNGEWIEGSLINDGRCFIAIHPSLAFGPTSKDEINGETLWGFYPFFEVDPSTVGQYTGLTANGKKIFEGDIILRRYVRPYFLVEYSEEETEYQANFVNGSCASLYKYFSSKKSKVIGNIHDNPELFLKGEQHD